MLVSALGSIVPLPAGDEVTAQTASSTDIDLFGYAWSSNIGWISFKGNNYGVKLKADGTLYGHAWANPRDTTGPDGNPNYNNIGWIDFDPPAPYPAGGPNHGAKIDSNSGNLIGWARAVTPATNPSGSAGWDGWIKMSGNKQDGTPWDNGGRTNVIDGHKSLVGFAWGDEVVGWISLAPGYTTPGCPTCPPVIPPGDCDPTKQVCIDNPNNDALSINCYSDAPFVAGDYYVARTGSQAVVEWTAEVLSGTPNYEYEWIGDGISPNPTIVPSTSSASNVITATYNATGTMHMKVTVTDNAVTPRTKTCSRDIVVGDDVAPPDDPQGTGGKLTVQGEDGVIYIGEQATGHAAETIVKVSRPAAEIKNDGDVGSVVNDIEIFSITGKDGTPLDSVVTGALGSDYHPKCILASSQDTSKNTSSFQPCGSVNFSSLSKDESVYFRLQIPGYAQAIADNSPYTVTISGTTKILNTAIPPVPVDQTITAKILFNYLVGTYTPQ